MRPSGKADVHEFLGGELRSGSNIRARRPPRRSLIRRSRPEPPARPRARARRRACSRSAFRSEARRSRHSTRLVVDQIVVSVGPYMFQSCADLGEQDRREVDRHGFAATERPDVGFAAPSRVEHKTPGRGRRLHDGHLMSINEINKAATHKDVGFGREHDFCADTQW